MTSLSDKFHTSLSLLLVIPCFADQALIGEIRTAGWSVSFSESSSNKGIAGTEGAAGAAGAAAVLPAVVLETSTKQWQTSLSSGPRME
jgi:hypothetical protein